MLAERPVNAPWVEADLNRATAMVEAAAGRESAARERQHARACTDRDPERRLAAAQAFEDAGLDLDAAQVGALAASAFDAVGSRDGVSRASASAARCAER